MYSRLDNDYLNENLSRDEIKYLREKYLE